MRTYTLLERSEEIKKRRLLVFVSLLAIFSLFVTVAGADELDDLIAAAKEEGEVVVYASSSRIHVAAEAFQNTCGIKVQAHHISESENCGEGAKLKEPWILRSAENSTSNSKTS